MIEMVLTWLIQHPNEANAFAALGSFGVAFLALVVAGISIFYAARGLSLQRTHNRLSVVPVPFIAFADFENLVRIRIRNDGIGPLIVRSVSYDRAGIKNEHGDLVSYMPSLPSGLYWKNFSSGYLRSIRPGDEVILLELEGTTDEASFVRFRDACRKALVPITVSIEYTDVYGSAFSTVSRKLDWFGRRLSVSRKA